MSITLCQGTQLRKQRLAGFQSLSAPSIMHLCAVNSLHNLTQHPSVGDGVPLLSLTCVPPFSLPLSQCLRVILAQRLHPASASCG